MIFDQRPWTKQDSSRSTMPIGLLQHRDFSKVIIDQGELLLVFWHPPDIEALENEFRKFKRALHNESVLEAEMSKATPMNGFAQSWAAFAVRFPKLMEFCGGLATVFPGMSTVESDFNVLN
jgi:hypothetical protein